MMTGETGSKRKYNGSKRTGTDKRSSNADTHYEKPKIIPTIAYIDTEFNAFDYYGQNDGRQEIIEIGAVIMRGDQVVDGFRSFCALGKGHALTKRASDITGITKHELKDAPPFPEALEMMNVFLDMYNPRFIYAYGGEDKVQLRKSASLYDMGSPSLYYVNKIADIMPMLAAELSVKNKSGGNLSLGVKDLCNICGISTDGAHDAYNDALFLGRAAEIILSGRYDPRRAERVVNKKAWIAAYRSARRFKDKHEEMLLNDEQLEPIRFLIGKLCDEGKYNETHLLALWDDLLTVSGREPENE